MTTRYAGFTMIEVLIAVVIIAILTAVALPGYRDYVQRGKITEATTGLSDFRVRMEQFYQDNRRYDGAGLGGCGAVAPASKYFTFTCVPGAAPAQTYVATARGVPGEGMADFAYTIDQANGRTSTITASGWTGNATCWAIKKGGAC